jgi:hypothetical protein
MQGEARLRGRERIMYSKTIVEEDSRILRKPQPVLLSEQEGLLFSGVGFQPAPLFFTEIHRAYTRTHITMVSRVWHTVLMKLYKSILL